MLNAVVLAGAIAIGVPFPAVAVIALGVYRPWLFVVAAVAWAVVSRIRGRAPQVADEEARFLEGVASEIRAGSSLRAALPSAASRSPGLALAPTLRLAAAGRPMDEVARPLRDALPANGRIAAAALVLSSSTGARASAVFARLAQRAADRAAMAKERRALTAQARLSAAVVGGAPLVLVALLWLSGRGATFFETGTIGLLLGAVGLAMEAAGGLAVWLMIRRAGRR